MTRPDDCYCADFQPKDPDDTLCYVCECDHVQEEHAEVGFFKPCKFNREVNDDGE